MISLRRRFANATMTCATRLLPVSREHWADAMRAELLHLNDLQAIRWACGCVIGAIQEKVGDMLKDDLKISRPLFVAEMLLCFIPLTWAWFEVAFGRFGVVHMTLASVQRDYVAAPAGACFLAGSLFWSVIGVLGPIGLIAGCRSIIMGKILVSRALCAAMLSGPALIYLPWLIGNWLDKPTELLSLDQLRGFILTVLLPVAATLHLMRIGLWRWGPLLARAGRFV